MAKKRGRPPGKGRPKVKFSRYMDADLWDRLQAFASSQEPVVTDSAVIETAVRHYLDSREKTKK